jgi:hypothetical protein
MSFDDIDFTKIPTDNKEEAFVLFERATRYAYQRLVADDRESLTDQHGHYTGYFDPERSYVARMIAFLDEKNLEIEIEDISDLPNDKFLNAFAKFRKSVEYASTRFSLRKNNVDCLIGTRITISSTYKLEIGELLQKIRKIVNQEVTDLKKRDKIFKKLAILQSEVDRDQTTIDSLFSSAKDVTKTLGECAENLEPLMELLERVKKLFWDTTEKVPLLPKKEETKLITNQQISVSTDLDDDIPF